MRACTQSQAHTHAHIQAESLTKLFPAGSALAKVFEAQELKEKARELKEKEKAQELKEKEEARELKEKEKAQELKEKDEAREFKEKKREEEVKQRLDILSLAVGILVFVLLAQSHGFGGALNTVFKSVLRI
jgi:sRNA-binding protein